MNKDQHTLHSRHKMSRYEAWKKINAKHLITPPSREICQELLITALSDRVVSDKLEITFANRRYDVRDVPTAKVGEKIIVGKNPYRPDCVQVQCFAHELNVDGEEVLKPYWVVLEPIEINELGFRVDAAMIGEEYKPHKKSVFESNRETLEQLAYGVDNEDDLKRAKKANKPLFNGEINPYQHIDDHNPMLFMPKRGQEHELTTNAKLVELKPLSVIEAAKRFKAKFGEQWTAESFKWLQQRYPNGIAETELEALLSQSQLVITPLRVVNG